ncbi:alpha amylase [Arthrobacter sp. Hiyo4]|nr:alpha amylase [Arthrobacter sp. Hiyo4]
MFHDVAALDTGTPLEYRATVLDNGGHTSTSAFRTAAVPAPILTLQKPVEGSSVEGSVELSATADSEKSSHVVTFERSVAGGEWTAVGSDDSSPVYSAADDLAALGLADGTAVQYRASMTGPVSAWSANRGPCS